MPCFHLRFAEFHICKVPMSCPFIPYKQTQQKITLQISSPYSSSLHLPALRGHILTHRLHHPQIQPTTDRFRQIFQLDLDIPILFLSYLSHSKHIGILSVCYGITVWVLHESSNLSHYLMPLRIPRYQHGSTLLDDPQKPRRETRCS